MMRYSKYLMGKVLGPFALITLSLTSIVWLSQSLRFIDLIVNRGLNIPTFLYFSSLLVPSLLWVILPVSLFISVVYAFNKLNMESELVVLKTSGISKSGIFRPVLQVTLLITTLSYAIGLYLLPVSYREFKDLQNFIRDNYVSILLQEGVFSTPAKNLTVYIRERDRQGRLYGMLVHDDRVEGKRVTMMAEEGKLVQSETGPRFILSNGNRQERNTESGQITLLHFDRYALDLSVFITESPHERWREPQERYLGELFQPRDTPINLTQKLMAEGHQRLLWPLYNILMAMLALIPFMGGQNRRGNWKKLALTSCLAIVMIILSIALHSMSGSNRSMVPLMYIAILFSLGAGWYILLYGDRRYSHLSATGA